MLSLDLYPVTFLFLFTVKFTKDLIDSLRRLCAKIHLWIKSHCCFMLIIFRVDFSLIWRLSVLRHSSKHHTQPAESARQLIQHWYSCSKRCCREPPGVTLTPFHNPVSDSLWARVAGLCIFSIVFMFFVLCLNDDLIQNILNVSVLLLFLLFQWS